MLDAGDSGTRDHVNDWRSSWMRGTVCPALSSPSCLSTPAAYSFIMVKKCVSIDTLCKVVQTGFYVYIFIYAGIHTHAFLFCQS
jgi:hypothetical protein